MASDIDRILYPKPLINLRENISPVNCIVWKGKINGEDDYDVINFDRVYPFDTIDTIKRMIYAYYKDPIYIPRFLFMGVPLGENAFEEEEPDSNETYHSIDYLWYPTGTNDPKQTYALANPLKTLTKPDMRFVSSDGSYASPNYELRGRSTIEQVFLKPNNGRIPVFHIYPLQFLLQSYRGPKPLSEEDWNKRFAPYFPDVAMKGPYQANSDDIEFGKKISSYIYNRDKTLNHLNQLLRKGHILPTIKLSGIRQMMLIWKKPMDGFEGSASMFYQILTTRQRPYIRLLPADGSPITKLHVEGILPIPSLDDPRVIEIWSKETSPTPNIDFCTIKYIHRPSIGITQPIYGTIHVLNDGTINLQLQPPKQIKALEPVIDFRNFNTIVEDIFTGLPQQFNDYELKEISVIFKINNANESTRFTKKRIQDRLPYFSSFFKEIVSVPTDNPIISLRFKAVSQYASEDKIFTFITQIATEKSLDGEALDTNIINAIQEEFQLSKREATDVFADWFKKRGTFTLQLPEDGEFVESFHPGIDIHIYSQHPLYYFHINRIDNFETYNRIYTLLSLLFTDDDSAYNNYISSEIAEIEDELQEASEEHEMKDSVQSNQQMEIGFDDNDNDNDDLPINNDDLPINAVTAAAVSSKILSNKVTASTVPSYMDDPFSNEGDRVDTGEVFSDASLKIEEVAAKPAVSVKIPSKIKPKIGKIVDSSPIATSATIDINPNNWFINKLQQIDSRLFSFKVDKQDNVYSRKCAANDDRQPVVMTKDQFERMRKVYENDSVFWIVYPLEGSADPIIPIDTKTTITVMRYGSDSDNMHYYFCPHYYCLYDELMIIEDEFNGTLDRKKHHKPSQTCPFCHGKLITNRKKGEVGYTVVKRKDKQGSTYHKYIDFMTKTTHPENFALPCCFIKQSSLRISDPEFSHLRDYLQEKEIEENKYNEEKYGNNAQNASNAYNEQNSQSNDQTEIDDYDNLVYKGEDAIEFAVLFETMHKRYIIESNKHPSQGIFAIAPLKFDKFFKQNSTESIIARVAIHLKLQPKAQGFLRIGTQNTIYESLLGVIAPLIYKNTIQEVKDVIKDAIKPRIFINAHFGNLVLEFYNPADGSAMPPTRQELMAWSQKNLGIALNSTNLYPLIRIYNSYKRFIRFIDDPTQRKDLRHIQPLLAEPELLTTKGIQLIVIEDNGKEDVNIRCPTFGVSMDRHKTNDMVFISRSLKTIGTSDNKYAKYELFIHTSNKPAKGGESAIHEHIIKWDHASYRIWPDIVKQRINEYLNQCQSRYRSLYTSQQGVHSMSMIPLSKIMDASPYSPEGIIKDNYNHIVGVTFRSKPGSQMMVGLPVVDDGVISITSAISINNIYLDWNDFKPAPVEDVIQYYKAKLEPLFALYPGYIIKHIVRQKIDTKIVAVQLENGIYIPVAPPKNESIMNNFGISLVEIEQFEWEIDKQLAGIKPMQNTSNWNSVLESTLEEKSCGADLELTRESSYENFEELYQQFRVMVSNWITSHIAGSEIRKGMEDIMFNSRLPEYERRKRMYILISSTLLSWFYSDADHQWSKAGPVTFLRKDCRLIGNPNSCTGTCYWKEEENGGKCLLHVNDTTTLHDTTGERKVSTAELFTKRIIDELVRFPARRKQLLKKNEISKITRTIKPIRNGNQYIIPESSIAWTNLLRLDWAKQMAEEPKYYEEMSGTEKEKEFISGEELPNELRRLFEDNTSLRLKIPTIKNIANPLLPFTSILGITLDELGLEPNATKLNKSNLIKYVAHMSRPIGFIDMTQEEKSDEYDTLPEILFARPMRGAFDTVTIFVFLQDKIGLLIEEDGNSTVTIASLPQILKNKWATAGLVQGVLKRVPVESKNPTIMIGRKPIIAPVPHIPLIAQQSNNPPKIRKRPRIGKFHNTEPTVVKPSSRKPKVAMFHTNAPAPAPAPAPIPVPAPVPAPVSVSAPASVPVVSAPVKSARKPRVGSFHTDVPTAVSVPVEPAVSTVSTMSAPVKLVRKPRVGSFHTDVPVSVPVVSAPVMPAPVKSARKPRVGSFHTDAL